MSHAIIDYSMDLVDSKGRVLGKVNVVDLMVVVVVLAVLAISIKLLVVRGPEQWVYVEMVLCESNPNPLYKTPVNCGRSSWWLVEQSEKVGVIYADYTDREVVAEVIDSDVQSLGEWGSYSVRMRMKLKAEADDNGVLYFGDSELKVGSPLEFKTKDVDLFGVVIRLSRDSLSGVRSKRSERNITMLVYNVKPWFAGSIHVGDRQVESDGSVSAVVTSKMERPAETITTSEDGGIFLKEHPLHKDIVLNATITVSLDYNELLFNNEKLLVGNNIRIRCEDKFIDGFVTDIY